MDRSRCAGRSRLARRFFGARRSDSTTRVLLPHNSRCLWSLAVAWSWRSPLVVSPISPSHTADPDGLCSVAAAACCLARCRKHGTSSCDMWLSLTTPHTSPSGSHQHTHMCDSLLSVDCAKVVCRRVRVVNTQICVNMCSCSLCSFGLN